MRTINICTKLKENPTRSNDEIYILDPENSEGRHNMLHVYIDHRQQSTNYILFK